MITKERWEVAKGGRSVNAGRLGKIRMEPGLPPEEIARAMRLIAAAPLLLGACRSCLKGLETGKGSIPFMITMLRGAIAETGERT